MKGGGGILDENLTFVGLSLCCVVLQWRPPAGEIGPEGPPSYDVIFLGLAFLSSRQFMAVDLDKSLLSLGPYRDLDLNPPTAV